ncbi:hypothetical protein [Tabrizicola sp. M-4]|uniref:hypothetical protein n=1 Tax=Tabrizicola sp. M-4 TaxID=3055847 RepID=UPI003DA9448C
MNRHRSLMTAGATLLIALGAGQYMASGTAQSTTAMTPVPSVSTSPALRLAAATPLGGYDHRQIPHGDLVPAAATPEQNWSQPATMQTGSGTEGCAASLDVFTGTDATLSVTLTAPCAANQTLVLRHAGLAVTYRTTASGAFFADIPALDALGQVAVRLEDGQEISAASPVPDIATINRLVVQGMGDDRFSLQTEQPRLILGEATGPVPLLAEVATWPEGEAPPVGIEAAVTETTCGRELLGEVILSETGRITRSDLTLAMPECDGVDGFVALNNPLPDMKLAATE